jgi:methylmalonyl-CoA carboxyltransferase large subunit
MSGTDRADLGALVEAVGALREELARLGERVAALEAATAPATGAGAAPGAAPPAGATAPPTEQGGWVKPETLDPELLLVISAAIAAFLGKKPHIRQIRLHTSPTWVQVGRVNIQGSHALPVHRSGASL